MAKKYEVYKCGVCGITVEVLNEGGGTLICCGEEMKLFTENTVDAATEKHIPVVEKISGGVKVSVGEVAHPMEEKHYIEWIEIIADGAVMRQYLCPGQVAEATFMTDAKEITVRSYCNLHGLWKA